MPSKTINYHCRRCLRSGGHAKEQLAHFSTKKNLLPRALLAVCLLAVLASAATRLSSAANVAAATASASASATTIGHNQHHHQLPLQPPRVLASASSNKWEQQQHQITRRHQEEEAEQLLEELMELEARPSESLDECAHWFNLNLRHRELLEHLLQAEPAPRSAALQKESECDAMEQVLAEIRSRMDKFKRLLRAEKRQIEFVSELASEYLELMNAAPENEHLARELADLRSAGGAGKTQRTLEELEQLLDFVGGLAVERARGAEPQAMVGTASYASGPAHNGGDGPVDELAELDYALRRLIDREPALDSDELGQLAELGGILERRLTDHAIDVGSGRFRALSGTLDAVRTIVMHRLAEEEEEAAEAGRRARELAAQEEEEAEQASRKRRVRDRMSNLSAKLASKIAPLVPPPASRPYNPLVAASSVAAATGPVSGGVAASAATTNFKLGRERQLQTPLVATPLAMGSTGTSAAASASASAISGSGSLANRRNPLMGHTRI